MASEKAPPAPAPPASRQNGADGSKSAAAIGDIRRSRPYFLSPEPLAAAARRAASIAALIALDLVGLTLGVYGAGARRLAQAEARQLGVPPGSGLAPCWPAPSL
jgi:hypothetical protein